ncbi:MAG: 30S ribosomal protein S17 [Oligoflexia bacterium]|nr:30S ribosomal protein S17 [Oligoflexia bacterium]
MATERKTKAAPAAKSAAAQSAAKKAAPAAVSTEAAAPVATHRRKEVVGTVVSDKMQKTIVVKVDRRVRHGLYKKFVVRSRRFKAHDEKNQAKIGDIVSLVESRPLSRDKRWALQSIVRKASQVAEANV